MASHDTDPDGTRLPFKLDTTTNGEYLPRPLKRFQAVARAHAERVVGDMAKRAGLSRRRFLAGAGGMAGTLAALNEAFAAAGRTGGRFAIPPDAAFDAQLAQATVNASEFVFDVQGHHVNPQGKWRDNWFSQWHIGLRFFPQARCDYAEDSVACLSAESFIKEVFLDSDTDMCVLSMVSGAPDENPLTTEEAAMTRAMVEAMEGNHRLMIHGLVQPNYPGAVEAMERQLADFNVAAWKAYTQWGPDGKGYWLDDPEGIAMIEKARELDLKRICVHKGLPLPGLYFGADHTEYARPTDIGRVAKAYPDVDFIVYHSGYDPDFEEGAYDPNEDDPRGVNELIRSMEDNGIGPGGNVYAELGSTWRQLMGDPTQAAHLIGKLLKHVGEDNILWGTDSIWYGSPQDQIAAFRTFEISEELQERHGYPAITPEVRAKIFGLNGLKAYGLDLSEATKRAALDPVSRVRGEYAEAPVPAFETYGPKTRREFVALLRENGGKPH